MTSTTHLRSSQSIFPARLAALGLLLALIGVLAGQAFADHTSVPTSITIAGSLQDELGCPGDWQPECTATHLTYEADDDVWQGTFSVPAGGWEYKAALNNTWDENYGANAQQDGANIVLSPVTQTDVKFYYDHKSHWITDNVNSVIATAAGSFQGELGCPGDWQPSCLRSWLQDPDGDGVYKFSTFDIPAGDYEMKVALDEDWIISYPTENLPFSVQGDGDRVTITWNSATNEVGVNVESGGIEPGDEELVRPVIGHPFQDEVLYFTIPDRFENGAPSNNCGAYTGPCVENDTEANVLTHGFLPSDRGYYHGGDLAGLQGKFSYLENLGVTAIWVGPIYLNKVVQPDSGNLFGHSSGYHGYWILDFTQVDPHLGTNGEFQTLVDAAHARGIKVFMDIVTNHTADVIQLEGNSGYRNKTNFPYLDTDGQPFDDSDFAYSGQSDYTFPDVDENSFPYRPTVPAGQDNAKTPIWLNDPLLYHNRGDSSFQGENSLYGDFFGLDDLWTERKEVVDGMIDIFKQWIEDFGVDGFRIDTTKHINMEFWQKFGPDIVTAARDEGIDHFFAFGEVFDQQYGPSFLSEFSTRGKLQSTIDFAFQLAARDFASKGGATDNLRDFFEKDDYYTDADSNAYAMPTFVGNHDIGRIGYFLKEEDQLGADDAELLARSKLVHALMFFARGQPVIYYGDEQGFTGDGGDKLARQDMFPSQVSEYNDDDLIGTDATTADDNFDPTHPIYQALAAYAGIYRAHPALRRGAQIHRHSEASEGIYAFSRIARDEKIEYVVVFNNSESEDSAKFPTASPSTTFTQLYPGGGSALSSDADGNLNVTVPGLAFVIYRADTAVPGSVEAPAIQISNLTNGQEVALMVENQDGHEIVERLEVLAELDRDLFAEVTFAAKVNDGDYVPVGTDNNPPYRIFYDVTSLPEGATVSFKAIVNDLSDNLNAAKVTDIVPVVQTPEPPSGTASYAIIHYFRDDGDYGDHTTGNFNDFWGLHLWGECIDDSEVTEWTGPKPFLGEDDYGRFAWIKLKPDCNPPVNFIIHRGDTKDGTDADRSFNPLQTPQIWTRQNDASEYASQAEAQRYVTIHYHRDDGDYGDPTSSDFNDFWGLHLWGDAIDPSEVTEWASPKKPDGEDDYGVFWKVKIQNASLPVNFIIHRGDTKDPGPDQSMTPNATASVWIQSGDETIYKQRTAAENFVIIHYHRDDGDYGDPTSDDFNDFWGLHVWDGAANPTEWTNPLRPEGQDGFGIFWIVELAEGATELAYIIHRGDEKDPGPDQRLGLETYGHEVWQLEMADPDNPYVLPIVRSVGNPGDLSKQQAYWVDEQTIAWGSAGQPGISYKLHYAANGGLEATAEGITGSDGEIILSPGTLSDEVKAKFPHLAGLPALQIPATGLAIVPEILKGQFAVSALEGNDQSADATGLQIPGVLDDLFTYDGELGISWDNGVPILRVWVPTAKSVTLHLFEDSDPTTRATTFPMQEDPLTGVWEIEGWPNWDRYYYLYEIEVFVPSTGQVEHNLVTDPYSLSLAMDSKRSQIVNLDDRDLKPRGWSSRRTPALQAPEDIVIYELHVRDFSIEDFKVRERDRGTFNAFRTRARSRGIKHLRRLSQAGLTHIHLLPAFDCGTIPENPADRQEPEGDLGSYPPDSEEQQAAIEVVKDVDGFNWCYDPFHYTTPEGSYSTNPDGVTRIFGFRQMVHDLHRIGLRVVMDVVYNHTTAGGQADKSVLDKVVPGYYHRLNADGVIETSTCCSNTATEHNMMEKLMIDSLIIWARDYKVDGFRFDLMGHHMKRNMEKARDALQTLTLEEDGVDGSTIYIYGEGWNFGEVADNARGENATQINMAGTGIGTFNDRIRDAIRGGGPFDGGQDLIANQGFINGLYYDPNALNSGSQAELDDLLLSADQIRVGLAGNLKDYTFEDRNGNVVSGYDVDYNGAPTGYTLDPQEDINYSAAHDNQTQFDIIQYKAPLDTAMDERVRMQNMGISLVALGQGIPFFHAGIDMLRSKSFDQDSFNSGDWFNALDFTYEINNWGKGLPPREKNEANWDIMRPLLADPSLAAERSDILKSVEHLREMLKIRKSSPLFRLRTAEQVQEKVEFLNTGPDQIPGLIVMSIVDENEDGGVDRAIKRIVVLFNATHEKIVFAVPELIGYRFDLDRRQRSSKDRVVRQSRFRRATGEFTVPGRTTAVFVAKRRHNR